MDAGCFSRHGRRCFQTKTEGFCWSFACGKTPKLKISMEADFQRL
jgi:hypothetical protein